MIAARKAEEGRHNKEGGKKENEYYCRQNCLIHSSKKGLLTKTRVVYVLRLWAPTPKTLAARTDCRIVHTLIPVPG